MMHRLRAGRWLALHSERPNLPWKFCIVDSDDFNAFSTPGGYVLVTRGLFDRTHPLPLDRIARLDAAMGARLDALPGLVDDLPGFVALRNPPPPPLPPSTRPTKPAWPKS